MKRTIRFLTCILVICFMAVPVIAESLSATGELIVRLKRAPQRNVLDQVSRCGIQALDTLIESGRFQASAPLAVFEKSFPEAGQMVLLRSGSEAGLRELEETLAADPGVAWVTRNHIYRPNALDEFGIENNFTPNDSLFSEQWWLQKIYAPSAWEITAGDSTVLLGIIDTGVDYLHPDLYPNIWINWADADSDGIDDDENGFIDDAVGWDFVDAPSLPSSGDHLERDNDPMDELGHGTYVAGIAAAATNNQTCYASVGYNCRILCLRAGNSEGFLEEDDVAAALLYGAELKMQTGYSVVLNMSFGDVVASPLLREAVRLAYETGVVILGSAGNSNSEAIHYPSGYPEVISVGATDSYDRRASFSNYGPSVHVMAPGYSIRSTILGGGCGEWTFSHGTSYAVPMVAALAGLILSVNPDLSPDDVKQVIVSTADDLHNGSGSEGWDPETAHGRVNARRAVEQARYGSDVAARITLPQGDQGILDNFTVRGEAWGASFERWELSYGLGENPDSWNLVNAGSQRIYDDSLARVVLPAMDTVMTLRLSAFGTGGITVLDHVHLYVQRTPPVFDSMIVRRMLDRDTYGDLVQVRTNQITTAGFIMTNISGDSVREDFGYVAKEHAGFLVQSAHSGAWQVRVRLENRAGLYTMSSPFSFAVNDPPFTSNLWVRTQTALVHGYLSSFYTDLNCNGRPEVWLLPIGENGLLSTLEVNEWSGTDFTRILNTNTVYIPQAAGDADQDGLFEIMLRRGQTTQIWEQNAPCTPPDQVVFSDTVNFVCAGFLDLDTTDGHGEIIARLNVSPGGFDDPRFVVFAVGTGYSLTPLDTIPNHTPGDNTLGPPKILTGDLDGDNHLDFLYGDYDGDIIFCEYSNGDIVQKWSKRLPVNDATSWFGSGDLDGDGRQEFVAGCRSNLLGGSESQRRSRHWEYFIFETIADDSFAAVDSLFILGNEDVSDHPSSINIADVDGDGRSEILISAFPDYYIVRYDEASGRYTPAWYYTPAEANVSLIADWDGNGLSEIFFTDGDRFLRVEAAGAFGNRPAPPLNLSGEPLGIDRVTLQWNRAAQAESYRIYRANANLPFTQISTTPDTAIILENVPQNTPFNYAVSSINRTYPQEESVFSNYVRITANEPPSLQDTGRFVEPYYVEVRFSEAMGPSSLYQWAYRLDDGRMPSAVSPAEGGRTVYLAFPDGFTEGWHRVSVSGLRDAEDSRLPDSDSGFVFEVRHISTQPPRILTHRLLGSPTSLSVEVTFTEPMSTSVLETANYRMEAPRSVVSVQALSVDRRKVQINMDSRYPVGAVGLAARLMFRGLASETGVPMDTIGGRADLLLGGVAASISDAYVFPNPYTGIGAGGDMGVMFAALPEKATIRIFTIQGVLIRKIEHNNLSGGARWDLTNENGDPVAGGVYLYTIEARDKTVRGKLAVLR